MTDSDGYPAAAALDPAAPWRVTIDYTRLSVAVVCTQGGGAPPFLGSALRGAFGHALRRLGCSSGCRQGRHATDCAYAPVFEPAPHPDTLLKGQRSVAPPFIFVPSAKGPMRWTPKRPLHFDWVLLGPAFSHAPLLLEALHHALADGLGSQNPARFTLRTAHAVNGDGCCLLYTRDEEGGLLREAIPVNTLDIAPGPLTEGTLEVEFVTPLHLRSKGAVLRDIAFPDLARALLFRLEALATFGSAEGKRDVHPLMEAAQRVRTVSSNVQFTQRRRYSNRQKRGLNVHGLTGACTFAGPVGPFLPLLLMASHFHLGHGTAWGMGRLRWRLTPS